MRNHIRACAFTVCLLCAAAFCLCLTSCTSSENTSQAETLITTSLGEDSLTEDLVKTVAQDLAMLEKFSAASSVEKLVLNDDGTITYIAPIDGDLRDEMQVRKESNGDIVLDIQEGDVYNEMTYTASGKLLLNGKEMGAN